MSKTFFNLTPTGSGAVNPVKIKEESVLAIMKGCFRVMEKLIKIEDKIEVINVSFKQPLPAPTPPIMTLVATIALFGEKFDVEWFMTDFDQNKNLSDLPKNIEEKFTCAILDGIKSNLQSRKTRTETELNALLKNIEELNRLICD